jgi:hypothetical protein
MKIAIVDRNAEQYRLHSALLNEAENIELKFNAGILNIDNLYKLKYGISGY